MEDDELFGSLDIARVIKSGPRVVLVNDECKCVKASYAEQDFNVIPEIIFVRRDGWTLGAPIKFQDLAFDRDEWVAFIDVEYRTILSILHYHLSEGYL